MQKQASSLSSKLPVEGSTADSQTIKALYHRVLLRDPQPDEVDLAQRFLGEAGTLQGSEPFRWTYGTHRLSRDPSGKVTLSDWKPFGAINKALTSHTTTERLLGKSGTATARTNSLFLGTGNNTGPIKDMRRRVVTARLAAPIVRALTLGMRFFMRNPF
jgi:hypothetical protein